MKLSSSAPSPTASAGREAPRCDIDLFGDEAVGDPQAFWERMRALGPVVYLEKNGCYFVTSHAAVAQLQADWRNLTSSRGIGIRDNSQIVPARAPGLLLETDPPEHTRFRKVMLRLLSVAALKKLRDDFETAAARGVDEVVARGTFDGLADLVRPFTLNVIADAVGLPQEGREHLLLYGAMIVEATGPDNARFQRAVARVQAAGSLPWVANMMKRSSLSRDGLAAEVFAAADAGEISEAEAEMLVRIFLAAAVDSTVYTLTNGLKLLADHPAQYARMRDDPALVREAFEEVLRMHSAPGYLFRTTNVALTVAGVDIGAGVKVAMGLGAANRDPAKFTDPTRFDIRRRPAGNLAFGVGIHACVGQMVARLEAEVLYRALAQRVQTLQRAGVPEPLDSHSFTSWQALPLRVTARTTC